MAQVSIVGVGVEGQEEDTRGRGREQRLGIRHDEGEKEEFKEF